MIITISIIDTDSFNTSDIRFHSSDIGTNDAYATNFSIDDPMYPSTPPTQTFAPCSCKDVLLNITNIGAKVSNKQFNRWRNAIYYNNKKNYDF